MGKDKVGLPPVDTRQVWTRSCDKETITPISGEISGNIPTWLNGRLTRNGPGKTQYGKTRFSHVFDGSAYLHQFNIKDGNVTYQSRFLQSDTYLKNSKADRIIVTEFGTAAYPDPCKNIFQRFMSHFTPLSSVDPTDNCVVSVCYFGDELYALTETKNMRRIDPETLAAVGEKTKLDNYIAVNTATAHPHVDPDGTVYNMGNFYADRKGPSYNIIKFPPQKEVDGKKVSSVEQAVIAASIPCQWKMRPSYYHSFGITDKYFIFVEQPFVFNLKTFLINHYVGKPYLGAVEWHSDQKTKFRIVRRDTGKILETCYQADAFLTFHHTNAYEKDGHLVIDLACMNNGDTVFDMLLKNLENPDYEFGVGTMPEHRRFVLPLNVQDAPKDKNLVTLRGTKCTALKKKNDIEVQSETISEQFFDLPRINYKYNGKEYTYAYGVDVNPKGIQFSQLVKMNVQTGETKLWHEKGKLVSEPVFVAAPNAVEEDQGVILSSLLDKENPKYIALLVLDPKTWQEMGRVKFEARGIVTSSFHGQFAGADERVHLY